MQTRLLAIALVLVALAGGAFWFLSPSDQGGDVFLPPTAEPVTDTPTREPATLARPELAPDTGPETRGTTQPSTRTSAAHGFSIGGSVLDPNGSTLTDRKPTVELSQPRGERKIVDVAIDGTYEIKDLGAGKYTFRCTAQGCTAIEEVIELDGRPRRIDKDVTLSPGALVEIVVLAGDGTPFADALRRQNAGLAQQLAAIATAEPPRNWVDDLDTDRVTVDYGAGRFDRRGKPGAVPTLGRIGVLGWSGHDRVYLSAVFNKTVLATRSIGPDQTRVDFTLLVSDALDTFSTAKARVVDAKDGTPLLATPIATETVRLKGQRHSSQRGTVEWRGLLAGQQTLRVSSAGRALWSRPIVIEPRQALDLGTISLGPGVQLTAKVVDAKGNPVAAAFVLGRVDLRDQSIAFDADLGYVSNRKGDLLIRSLGTDVYVLRTRDGTSPASGCVVADMRSGPIEDLTVTVHSTTPVTLADRDAMKHFKILDSQGYAIRSGGSKGRRQFLLPPGKYELVAEYDGRDPKRESFSVAKSPIVLGE